MRYSDLDIRMKSYETVESKRRLMPLLPAIARIDGRGFSSFSKGMARPFDQRLSEGMIRTTEWLVEKSNARLGYTQSDEISLVWYEPKHDVQIYFDGRIQKMVSSLASEATVFFYRYVAEHLPEYKDRLPKFDCRVFNVPNLIEATNCILARELDAFRNSVSMSAHHYFSHRELQRKKSPEMQEMLWQKGINFNDYPAFFKRGTYVRRRMVVRKFNAALDDLPEKHEARRNPDLMMERSEIARLDMPPIAKIKNRVDVIFHGAEPQTDSHD